MLTDKQISRFDNMVNAMSKYTDALTEIIDVFRNEMTSLLKEVPKQKIKLDKVDTMYYGAKYKVTAIFLDDDNNVICQAITDTKEHTNIWFDCLSPIDAENITLNVRYNLWLMQNKKVD